MGMQPIEFHIIGFYFCNSMEQCILEMKDKFPVQMISSFHRGGGGGGAGVLVKNW